MLFNFQAYIEELRENPEKKEVVEKYEKFFWVLEWEVQDQLWFKDYVNKLNVLPYKVPEELKEDFDWNLLMQLVGASFSSDWLFDYIEWEEFPEFVISVQSWEQVVVKKISELWWFQILRLYEIYIEEQMNLQILIAEDEKEKEAILAQRDSRIHRWNLVFDNLEKEKLEVEEKKEKEEKLSNLMDQL